MAMLKDSLVSGSLRVTDTIFSTNLNLSSLTASYAVLTDANKNLVSREVYNRTSGVSSLNNAATWADSDAIPTLNTIGRWDGRYQTNSNKSNIKYVDTIVGGTWNATAIGLKYGGTGADNTATAINKVFAGPSSGSAGNASFRTLVAADVPVITTASDTSNELYMLGVTSSATTTVKYNSGVKAKNGAITATTYNGLTLTAATTGFTIAGGTTSKTLTVAENCILNGGNASYLAYYSAANTIGGHSIAHITDVAGTTSVMGENKLVLGNSTATGTAANSRGCISLYSASTQGTRLIAADNYTAWYTATLQAKDGIIAYQEDIANQFTCDSNITYDPATNTFKKTSGGSSWNAQVYSKHGFSDGCYVSWKAVDTGHAIMIGLNTDPTTDANWTGLDYAWYLYNNANLDIRESNTTISSITGHTTYAAGDEFRIEYSHGSIRYYHNGVCCRTVERVISGKLYVDSCFHALNTAIADLQFGVLSVENKGNGRVFYGTCSTPAATAAKVVVCAQYDALTIGDIMIVTFSATNTTNTALTMKIQNAAENPTVATDAKSIKCQIIASISDIPAVGYLVAARPYEFIYDGTYWVMMNVNRDNNNNDVGFYLRNYNTNKQVTTNLCRYVLLFSHPTNTQYIIPACTTNNTTATNKTTITTAEFNPFNPIYYYNTTTTRSADYLVDHSNLWFHHGNLNLAYSFNTGTTLIRNRDVYLVLEMTSPTTARLRNPGATGDNASAQATGENAGPVTQILPTTNDGYVYMKLGVATTTGADSTLSSNISLTFDHPMYWHDGTSLRLYNENASYLPSPPINTEDEIEEGTRSYIGSGSDEDWTGSITSMKRAGILQVSGEYRRGWQIWAERGNGTLHWRNRTEDMSAWNTERIILDSSNYTNYLGSGGTASYLNAPNEAGITTDVYGNPVHKRTTDTDCFSILGKDSAHTAAAFYYETGEAKIGFRQVTSGPSSITYANRLTIVPYFHTGGPWYIKSGDDATNAYLALFYGSNAIANIKHDGIIWTKKGFRSESQNPVYGWDGLEYFNAYLSSAADGGGTSTGSPTGDWYHHLRMNHGNSAGYYVDIATCFHNSNIFLKRVVSGSSSGWKHIWVEGNSVTSAVWNDYAEYRAAKKNKPGQVLYELGDDTLEPTTERMQHFAGVASDTWGFAQGETNTAKTPIAVSGRVLAYPYQSRENYKPGDCVCAAPGGTVDIMTRDEIIEYPDRIVGTVSCVPDYEEWGGGDGADRDPVKVDGRIWIKVK